MVLAAVVLTAMALAVMIVLGEPAEQIIASIQPAAAKLAKVSRPMPDGIFCVNSTYDNTSGAFGKETIERCELKHRSAPRKKSMMNWNAE